MQRKQHAQRPWGQRELSMSKKLKEGLWGLSIAIEGPPALDDYSKVQIRTWLGVLISSSNVMKIICRFLREWHDQIIHCFPWSFWLLNRECIGSEWEWDWWIIWWLYWSWWERTCVWNQDFSPRVGKWQIWAKRNNWEFLGVWVGLSKKVWAEEINLSAVSILMILKAIGMGRITWGENAEERKEYHQPSLRPEQHEHLKARTGNSKAKRRHS